MTKVTTSIFIAAGLMLATTAVHAQTSTTGALKGVVKDASNSQAVGGATVIATSPQLQGQQAELTDSDGVYYIANLPPGTYQVTVFLGEGKWQRSNVIVGLGKVARVNITIDTTAGGGGETIIVEGTAPVIDQGSTKTGVTINEDYTRRVPTGRTFQGTLGAAAGSQGDLYGVSFGGSTSVENVYIVEGINTTDPAFGLASTNLPNEFVRETEVITGGYNAEFGRATGAVVNVVTKSGGNEFHGSVFSYFTPGALSPTPRELPRAGSSIATQTELVHTTAVGAELGGPIVKDKVWFHVGINPVFSKNTLSRNINRFTGAVDDNGFQVTENVGSSEIDRSSSQYLFHGKVSFAATPDHQGALSVFGNPGERDRLRTVSGPLHSGLFDEEDGAYDVSAKWTSKFNDNKSQVDAVVGYHVNRLNEIPALELGDTNQVRFDFSRPLADFMAYESNLPQACVDNPDDCPVRFYNVGGMGFRETQETGRLSGSVKFTQRVKAAGRHQFKVGADIEEQTYDHLSAYTGGSRFRYRSNDTVRIDRFFTVDDTATEFEPCGEDFDDTPGGDAKCAFRRDGLLSNTRTRNLGLFVQDSWSILPNLTVNAGLRWENQTAFVADEVQGLKSPTTSRPIPEKAFELKNMLAPRLGVIYDWTEEGRSKVFGHWGRFYESVPMDINARAYGGEVGSRTIVDGAACTSLTDATAMPGTVDCDLSGVTPSFFGGGEEVVVPDLKGQYMDELVAGVEYELLEDFKVGATYIRRGLGRIIEDVSVDGANTYIVANPGDTVSAGDIQAVRDQAAAAANPDEARYLENLADSFAGVNRFDEAKRTYNGLQLTAQKRFSSDVMLIGSYTFSKTEGNFPGLFSPDTGQLDPNLTSMYDLAELMANRYGDLPQDKPHLFKLDGYYVLDAGKTTGWFIFGGSARAASGRPINALGAHPLYGFGESYLLPRGNSATDDARTPATFSLDARVTYGRQLSGDMKVEAFFDVFNMFNSETTLSVEEDYTFDDAYPIPGGEESDLAHLKVNGSGNQVVEVNENYANATSDVAVRQFRFGLRLTF